MIINNDFVNLNNKNNVYKSKVTKNNVQNFVNHADSNSLKRKPLNYASNVAFKGVFDYEKSDKATAFLYANGCGYAGYYYYLNIFSNEKDSLGHDKLILSSSLKPNVGDYKLTYYQHPEYLRTSFGMRLPIGEKIYKPYCWETTPSLWEEEMKNAKTINSQGFVVMHEPVSNAESPVIRAALNREDSLKSIIDDLKLESRALDVSLYKLSEDIEHKDRDINYYRNTVKSSLSYKLLSLVSPTKAQNSLQNKMYIDQKAELVNEKETSKARKEEIENKIVWLQGEVDKLAQEREKGTLIDISVRNVDNPDAPLEQFLNSTSFDSSNAKCLNERIVSLPNEILKLADVMLIALGMARQDILPCSSVVKSKLLEPYLGKPDFAKNVMKGLNRVL